MATHRIAPRIAALWPAAAGALAVLYANVAGGAWPRRSAIAWMLGSWGTRLAVQSLYAVDPDTEFLTSLLTSTFKLLTFPLLLSLPALMAARNPEPSLTTIELAATGLWLVAFAAETTADRQRLRFRSNHGRDRQDGQDRQEGQEETVDEGLPCRTGLWRMTPRAHAWCEALIWTAFALFASASPWGWIAWSCPAVMIYLLFAVKRRY